MQNIDVASSIFIGVLSGVITSLLIWVIVKIFNNLLIPWYQAIVYKGIHIEGSWKGFYGGYSPKSRKEPSYMVSLKQNGHKINGELILKIHPNGRKEIKSFNINGLFRDNYLLLTFEPNDRKHFSSGNFLLKLVEDGQKLEGFSTYVTADTNKINTIPIVWIRI